MSETVKCSSGNEYPWQKPPYRIHWKHGRIANTYTRKVLDLNAEDGLKRQILESMTPDERRELEGKANMEKFYSLMESMSDEELARLEAYRTDLIKAGTGRADVSDISDPDQWELFARAMYGDPKAVVETDEGETTAETVETFRDEPGVSPVLADVPDVRGESVASDGVN